MYRMIHGFHPGGGMWKVQKSVFMGLIWITVYHSDSEESAHAEYMRLAHPS